MDSPHTITCVLPAYDSVGLGLVCAESVLVQVVSTRQVKRLVIAPTASFDHRMHPFPLHPTFRLLLRFV